MTKALRLHIPHMMRTAWRFFSIIGILVATLSPSPAYADVFWASKFIAYVQMDNRTCLFFTLQGVSEANPVVPGFPWFAIAKSNANYQEMLSMVLSAKLAGKPIGVNTDGTLNCSVAAAVTIRIEP